MPYLTGDTLSGCVRVTIDLPNDDNFIAAFWGQLSELGYYWNWETVGSITRENAALHFRDVFDNALAGSCINPTADTMQLIEQKTVDGISLLEFDIPDENWSYIRLVGEVTAKGSVDRDLRGALSEDTAANRYSLTRNTTTLTATSGTNTTESYIEFGWPAHNAVASESSDPAYSVLDWYVYRPRTSFKTTFAGTLIAPQLGYAYRFNGRHNIAQVETKLQLFISDATNIKANMSLYGVLAQ